MIYARTKQLGKDNAIGHKVEKVNGREFVNFVIKGMCTKQRCLTNSSKLQRHCGEVGQCYVNGTNYVTNHNVTKLHEGEGHRIALSIEKSKPEAERVGIEPGSGSGVSRLQI